MITRVVLALSLLVTAAASGQGLDPLRNVSGTASNPGSTSPWVQAADRQWTFFHGLDAHVTYVSETGPEEQRNEVFSTNWFAAGLHRNFGERGFVLVRGRVSLEPYTLPDDEGYPQILQYVSPAHGGGPVIDRMRPHDLFGEAAVQVGWRPTSGTLVSVYGALVGDPALGAPPFELRSSGVDMAEAPFSYDIQETTHDSTKVITAGFSMRLFTIEGSVFHNGFTTGDHTEIADGDIDSRSVRLTFTPTQNLAVQVSRGELGDEEREITSASLSFGGPALAVTALWTQREFLTQALDAETAYGVELALRGGRNTFMGRAEWVDRPLGFPELPFQTGTEQTTHFAVGYIYDFLAGGRYRTGIGVNVDYHTQSHDLEDRYGHKPQAIYAFVRFRTSGI
ncbi:MAG TPA: hypothetical protein VEK57_26425 [Thermoanaerobaculia bacterium]|nr:hypothetical protein [Thermoanaerobaculia bacterium]